MKPSRRLELWGLALCSAGVFVGALWAFICVASVGELVANGPWLLAILLLALGSILGGFAVSAARAEVSGDGDVLG